MRKERVKKGRRKRERKEGGDKIRRRGRRDANRMKFV